jgi:hypothetical protein
MAAAAAAARDRGAMDGIDGHFFMESRGHQGRIDPARVIVVAWTRHDLRGVKDTGAGRQVGIHLREADAIAGIHTSRRMARNAASSPLGGGRHGSEMRMGRERQLAAPTSGNAGNCSVTSTCSFGMSTAARAAIRAQSAIERWRWVSWSSCECGAAGEGSWWWS